MKRARNVYLDRQEEANTGRKVECVKCRFGVFGRSGFALLICFGALVAMVTAPPAGAQSVQDVMKQNADLMNQNKALMDQNRKLMEMIQKNASRIQKLETSASSGAVGAAPATTRRAGPLEERVKKLETKQAVLDKRSGDVATSGSKNVRLAISGQINRGVLIADDGDDTNIYNVDNGNSSTRFRFIGEADMGKWTAGTRFEAQFKSNPSDEVNQNNESISAELSERWMEFNIGHASYGKLSVGQGDTASNNTSEVDLSGTDVVGYSSIADMAGGQLFYDDNTNALSATSIGDVSSNLDGLSRDDRVRYDTPTYFGFSAATSYASKDKWDAAAFHSGKYGDFKVGGAVAYSQPRGSTKDRVNGSASVLHSSGFNATVSGGRQGVKSDDRDPWTMYGKFGYLVDWQKHNVPMMAKVGKTALAVDYQRAEDLSVKNDKFDTVGGFIVQKVDDWAADLYVGFRWHKLDRDNTDFNDVFATLVGGRFKF